MTGLRTLMRIAALLAGVCALPTSGGPPQMTPAELVDKVAASREAYKSFAVEMRQSFYKLEGGTMPPVPSEISEITWRSVGDRSLSHERMLRPEGSSTTQAAFQLMRDEYRAVAGTTVRSLIIPPEPSPPRGVIRTQPYPEPSYLSLADLVWYPLGSGFVPAIMRAPSLSLTVTGSEYVLEGVGIPAHGHIARLVVDAKRGWVPVKSEMVDPSGRVRFSSVCEDWMEVGGGLWVPKKITATSTYEVNVTGVLRAVVNAPVADADLELIFPPGTLVDDRISGQHYKVNQPTTAPATTGPAATQAMESAQQFGKIVLTVP